MPCVSTKAAYETQLSFLCKQMMIYLNDNRTNGPKNEHGYLGAVCVNQQYNEMFDIIGSVDTFRSRHKSACQNQAVTA